MDEKLLAVLLGIVAGAMGYWIATFWIKPILQHRELRMKVFADFIFYGQVVNADGLNDRMKTLYEERITSNCSGQVISDSLIDFFDVDSRSKALGDMLPSVECSLMLL